MFAAHLVNGTVSPDQFVAILAIAGGILACFWGYRILKVALGLTGFVLGAVGGWELGIALAPSQIAVSLVCAAVVGIIGTILCVWLFLVGVFLLGASGGGVLGAALFSASGNQPQILLIAALAVICGIIALLAQKFMIIVCSAFSGSYLAISGLLQFTRGHNAFPVFFDPSKHPAGNAPDLFPLLGWIVVALAGVAFQYRSHRIERENSD